MIDRYHLYNVIGSIQCISNTSTFIATQESLNLNSMSLLHLRDDINSILTQCLSNAIRSNLNSISLTLLDWSQLYVSITSLNWDQFNVSITSITSLTLLDWSQLYVSITSLNWYQLYVSITSLNWYQLYVSIISLNWVDLNCYSLLSIM